MPTLYDDDQTAPVIPSAADLDRDAAVDVGELYRMAERMEMIARRADADVRLHLGSRALVAADALRDVARDLATNPLPRKP